MAFKIEESITYWLLILGRAYRNQIQAHLLEYDLYAGQDFLLMGLSDEDGQTQAQLARRLHIQQATLTRMIQRMEQNDLVMRKPDLHDGRISRVFLTTAGKKLRKPVQAIWATVEAQAFRNLSAEERLLLRRLLMQLHLESDAS